MPPTTREQLDLDELLCDLYRGIEVLPGSTIRHYETTSASNKSPSTIITARTYVKEYELPDHIWLDRQRGRVSERRDSKELNERQVKEKAMIEELKRNLKNGAISLRQSPKQTTSQQTNYGMKHTRHQTLPHNYKSKNKHPLLKSHYRADEKFNTISDRSRATANEDNDNIMRNTIFNCNSLKSPIRDQQYQHQEIGDSISNIPSATEVVRSALSRSGSQASLNQLNKTINLLPSSPSPVAPSPNTPTQQLKPTTPSLSPSPVPNQRFNPASCNSIPNTLSQSNTMGRLTGSRIHQPQQPASQRTKTVNWAPEKPQQQQPVYANPHASLMQHRIEQQMKQPDRNVASIREFNELDSLLRSLSPTSTHITPGFSSKQSKASYGYGFQPAQQPVPHARPNDMYAKVKKQPALNSNQQANFIQQHQPQQRHYGSNNNLTGQEQFVIDASRSKDENCVDHQNLSEFEPPIELLPSMEDYQNISKLNPVKNHYWYKPNMSRDRAINLLKDKPQGTFIVRDSTSFRGAYGLAVKVTKLPKNVLNNASLRNPNADPSSELIRHFLIEQTGSGGVRLKGYTNEPVFDSLPDLIYQHSLTELALPCKLVIPRSDIEDPQFIHKQKLFYDEFLASKELAKHNPYESTSPNGGYRRYPGDVYVHNEHRIIFE